MDQRGFVDGLVADINGKVIETTMANLFWVTGETLYSPALDKCGVAGVMRRKIIEQAELKRMPLVIDEFDMAAVCQADEVFISNALLGVAPVCRIEEQVFAVGSATRYFQEKMNS